MSFKRLLGRFFGTNRNEDFAVTSNSEVSLNLSVEQQLEILKTCGIEFRPGISICQVLSANSDDDYIEDPFLLLLQIMGGVVDDEIPPKFSSDNIWHFDTECIENDGDYIALANRLSVLSGGALPLQKVEDYVSIPKNKAWISFELDGKKYRWDAAVKADWVDTKVVNKFAKLLAARRTGRRFTYFNLGGQDCLIGCSSDLEFSNLLSQTGLGWEWLGD